MTKLTEGKLSTAAQPPASRHVFVSAEYIIPGIACMQQCFISASLTQPQGCAATLPETNSCTTRKQATSALSLLTAFIVIHMVVLDKMPHCMPGVILIK